MGGLDMSGQNTMQHESLTTCNKADPVVAQPLLAERRVDIAQPELVAAGLGHQRGLHRPAPRTVDELPG